MSEQSSEPTAEGLTDADVAELRRLLANATPGRWKLWGMQVMADQDGTSNVDTAIPVAQTYFRDDNDKPRTWDASLIAETHNLLPALLAERDDLRAALDRVKATDFAAVVAAHRAVFQCDGDFGEKLWVECSCGDQYWVDTEAGEDEHEAHLAAVLRAAVEGGRS